VAKRELDAQLRELTDQAHGANLDLGHALIHHLTSVDPADIRGRPVLRPMRTSASDELCGLRSYVDAPLLRG
jgi:hypothetical protein